MTANDTPITERVAMREPASSITRMKGNWLWAAKGIWLVIILAAAGLIAGRDGAGAHQPAAAQPA